MNLTIAMEPTSGVVGDYHWEVFNSRPPRAYDCGVVVVQEEEGYSVHATDLPGAVSQGDTVEEALSNIREALVAVIDEYIADGTIPWSPVEIFGTVVCKKRILVNV